MTILDIFQREPAGEVISLRDPEYPKIAALITEAQRITAEMNTGYRDPAKVRILFRRLTCASLRHGRYGARTGAALLAMATALSAHAADVQRDLGGASNPRSESQEQPSMWMTVGTQRFAVALEDNPTARALQQLLPITLDMEELNGNEKHAALPRSLPTRSARPGTILAGDVQLYGDNTLVVFYDTFASSYSYTRIGRIEGSAGLASALGSGNQRVTFTVR